MTSRRSPSPGLWGDSLSGQIKEMIHNNLKLRGHLYKVTLASIPEEEEQKWGRWGGWWQAVQQGWRWYGKDWMFTTTQVCLTPRHHGLQQTQPWTTDGGSLCGAKMKRKGINMWENKHIHRWSRSWVNIAIKGVEKTGNRLCRLALCVFTSGRKSLASAECYRSTQLWQYRYFTYSKNLGLTGHFWSYN